MITLRKMTARDMVKNSLYIIPKFFGVVVVKDGRDIGSGSVVWGDGGLAYLCLEITDELRQYPIFMVKTAKSLIEGATLSGELFTIEDKEEPTAPRFLEFLGFKPTGEVKDGERILSWRKS